MAKQHGSHTTYQPIINHVYMAYMAYMAYMGTRNLAAAPATTPPLAALACTDHGPAVLAADGKALELPTVSLLYLWHLLY